MLKQLGIAVAVLCLTAAGLCQENHFDVSLGGTYAFSKQSSGNGIDLKPTAASGFLATVRLRFRPSSSFQFNYGRTKDRQVYTAAPFTYSVQSTIAEFTGEYIYNFAPHGKFEPFLMGGAGVLVFTPGETFVNTSLSGFGAVRQYRPAVLYGGGVDYAVYKRIGIRVQYRGLVFSNPDFNVHSLFIGGKGHMAEPAVGVVYKF
jgi:opacity protein-like surface antigen